MKQSEHVIEIFLQPGDFYFGDMSTRLRTLLGSCVSITMWHPTKLIGGMCHYMLPSRENAAATSLDGRYAKEAMQMFVQEIRAAKTHPSEYTVKLFGAGNMFPGIKKKNQCDSNGCMDSINACMNISCKNIKIARSLVAAYGFVVAAEDLGGTSHRQIVFDIDNGNVWVRKPGTIQA
ncbi:putative chemoreceptor glutamine deamidase CheD 3 [Candidatus Nitrotoga sp. HW29]|uniref:chemotaxis protein CheD n=1 Tax=Candidatus Nitrotoga sp. HW29 TaxID=2886963 RepID=UPI001EF3C87D|nr:chemotaxis protein CheD [Candidatus Nitrotoga sp. HW29]CAH1904234.1 putative chemoreceptor glutamine deamidase CheD 3 [Candidatus Nitrotoga sp. HW29]